MKAYKFRSSSQLPFALDIIFNSRLNCSDWRNLNDPMEGMFAYFYNATEERDPKEEVAQIVKHKKQLKVCSLSMTFDSHLLWAHYGCLNPISRPGFLARFFSMAFSPSLFP